MIIACHILASLAGMQLSATVRFLHVFTAESVCRSDVRCTSKLLIRVFSSNRCFFSFQHAALLSLHKVIVN